MAEIALWCFVVLMLLIGLLRLFQEFRHVWEPPEKWQCPHCGNKLKS